MDSFLVDQFQICFALMITRSRVELQPAAWPDSRTVGGAGVAVSAGVLVYYTAWVLIAPFIDGSEVFFPPTVIAITIPTVLFTTAVLFVTGFIGLTMLRSG